MTGSYRFHGVTVGLETESAALLDALDHDFSRFRAADGAPADVSITAVAAPPDFAATPRARAVMVQPGCVVYEAGGVRWVDYQGRALARWQHTSERGTVWSDDAELLHEIVYLLLLSRVGELHDRRGLHRVHALGLATARGGVLCLLPSGGGKTTLGLAALRRPGIRLLSDDAPLVTRRGDLLAFPSRIGVGTPPPGIAAHFLRRFTRRGLDDKVLIDTAAFADRLAERAPPHAVVLGERQLSGPARLEPLAAARAAPELLRSLVVGLGLPQVVEYFLRFDLADAVRKASIVASRSLATAALLARARTYRLLLARDSAENLAALEPLL